MNMRRTPTRAERRQAVRLAKRAALSAASPAPVKWWDPRTWGRSAKVELSPVNGSIDPWYADESRTIAARRANEAPEMLWRTRGADQRARARDATLRDPHAWSIVDKIAGNLVSTGIHVEPDATSTTKANAKKAAAVWKQFTANAFVGGWSFAAGLEQAAWSWVETGEVLVVRQWRPDLLPGVPLRLRLVEADLIDADKVDEIRDDGSRRIDGVELDRHGEVTGYWLLPEHPQSQFAGLRKRGSASTLVPARDVAHLYTPRRPGQTRGITDLGPILDDLAELDDYENAEAVRKTLDACIMAFVEPGVDEQSDGGGLGEAPSVVDAYGNTVGGLMQGAVVSLRGGKKVTMHSPAPTQGYEEYKRSKLRSVGAGAGVMYEHLSGDLSTVNYSSYRAGNIEFRRRINARRANYLVPRVLERCWSWCMDAAFVAGLVDRPEVKAKWTAPRWESVDPSKDAMADATEVEKGFALQPDKIAARGQDPTDFIARKKKWEDDWTEVFGAGPNGGSGDPPPAADPTPAEGTP